jgi:hypothetical protein
MFGRKPPSARKKRVQGLADAGNRLKETVTKRVISRIAVDNKV